MASLITDKEDLGYKLYPSMYSSHHSSGRGLSLAMFSRQEEFIFSSPSHVSKKIHGEVLTKAIKAKIS